MAKCSPENDQLIPITRLERRGSKGGKNIKDKDDCTA